MSNPCPALVESIGCWIVVYSVPLIQRHALMLEQRAAADVQALDQPQWSVAHAAIRATALSSSQL